MSSLNALAILNPSHLATVHPFAVSGNGGLGAEQTFVMQDNQGNAYVESTNVQMTTGNARDTGISAAIRNTYPARYNFAVRQFNATADDDVPKKKQMRGGRFLFYRLVLILAFLIAITAGGISSIIKPFIALNIVLCLIYVILSIYNIVIFYRNGSLFNRRMVHDNRLTKNNDYFTIPIHTSVRQTNAFASEHADIVAGLQNVYNHLDEVQIMVYNEYYVRTFTYFSRSIITHIVVFLFVMALGIFLSAFIQQPNTHS